MSTERATLFGEEYWAALASCDLHDSTSHVEVDLLETPVSSPLPIGMEMETTNSFDAHHDWMSPVNWGQEYRWTGENQDFIELGDFNTSQQYQNYNPNHPVQHQQFGAQLPLPQQLPQYYTPVDNQHFIQPHQNLQNIPQSVRVTQGDGHQCGKDEQVLNTPNIGTQIERHIHGFEFAGTLNPMELPDSSTAGQPSVESSELGEGMLTQPETPCESSEPWSPLAHSPVVDLSNITVSNALDTITRRDVEMSNGRTLSAYVVDSTIRIKLQEASLSGRFIPLLKIVYRKEHLTNEQFVATVEYQKVLGDLENDKEKTYAFVDDLAVDGQVKVLKRHPKFDTTCVNSYWEVGKEGAGIARHTATKCTILHCTRQRIQGDDRDECLCRQDFNKLHGVEPQSRTLKPSAQMVKTINVIHSTGHSASVDIPVFKHKRINYTTIMEEYLRYKFPSVVDPAEKDADITRTYFSAFQASEDYTALIEGLLSGCSSMFDHCFVVELGKEFKLFCLDMILSIPRGRFLGERSTEFLATLPDTIQHDAFTNSRTFCSSPGCGNVSRDRPGGPCDDCKDKAVYHYFVRDKSNIEETRVLLSPVTCANHYSKWEDSLSNKINEHSHCFYPNIEEYIESRRSSNKTPQWEILEQFAVPSSDAGAAKEILLLYSTFIARNNGTPGHKEIRLLNETIDTTGMNFARLIKGWVGNGLKFTVMNRTAGMDETRFPNESSCLKRPILPGASVVYARIDKKNNTVEFGVGHYGDHFPPSQENTTCSILCQGNAEDCKNIQRLCQFIPIIQNQRSKGTFTERIKPGQTTIRHSHKDYSWDIMKRCYLWLCGRSLNIKWGKDVKLGGGTGLVFGDYKKYLCDASGDSACFTKAASLKRKRIEEEGTEQNH